MNIWALQRDQDIKFLLLSLRGCFPDGAFLIDAETPVDCRAIYLQHSAEPRVRAYLTTIGQDAGRYGIQLEYPEEMITANLIDAYENLTLGSLVKMLSVHFDIAEVSMPCVPAQ